jgi:hypothetical protein
LVVERLALEWRSEEVEDGLGGMICGRMGRKHMDVVWRKGFAGAYFVGGLAWRREKEDERRDNRQTGACHSGECPRSRCSKKGEQVNNWRSESMTTMAG